MTLIAKILISAALVLLFGIVIFLKIAKRRLEDELNYIYGVGIEKVLYDYYESMKKRGDSNESN